VRREPRVAFYRDQSRRPRIQQGSGEPSGSGADLQHRGIVQPPSRGGDAAEDRWVEQEVLAQSLVGEEAMRTQPLAEAAERLKS
jgi:hypothetical protein